MSIPWKTVACIAGALCCGGCASIVSGQNQSISLVSTSQGADFVGARCTLVNDKGTWYTTTPGSVTVHRSFKDLSVDCDAEAAPHGNVAVKSSTKAMAFGNILFGGVIGVGVDTVSGAAYDYPAVITVRMGRTLDTATYASEAGLQTGATRTGTRRRTSPAPIADGAKGLDHRKRVPEATSFALATDASSVPVGAAGQQRYLHYLTLPTPKAFVVYESGGWRFWSSDADAMSKALDYCAREGRLCWLYAVDDQVVWQPERDKRIGKSSQLEER
jgi:hypothetical protein